MLKLFVYGTLKVGEWNHTRMFGGTDIKAVEGATINGLLYDMGFPALQIDPNQVRLEGTRDYKDDVKAQDIAVGKELNITLKEISGELFHIPDESILYSLDMLEGFVPGSKHNANGYPYKRFLMEVKLKDGSITSAWVYAAPEALKVPLYPGTNWSNKIPT